MTKAGVGTNRYGYSFNDPVNLRDPGGNEIYDETWNDNDTKREDAIERSDRWRDQIDQKIETLNSLVGLLESGRRPGLLSGEAAALARVKRASQPGTSDYLGDARILVGELTTVRAAFGDFGSGTVLSYGGKNGNGSLMSVIVRQPGQALVESNRITVFDEAFGSGSIDGWKSSITHELGHGVLGLSDRVPGQLREVPKKFYGADSSGPFTRLYDWKGIQLGWKNGKRINDAFACPAVGGCL